MTKERLLLIAALALAAMLAPIYYLHDPAQSSWMPRCLFHTLTGLSCPGCGSQRAMHALLHGDLAGALQANAFMLAMLPLLAAMVVVELSGREQWRTRLYHPWLPWTLLAALLVWTAARNIFGF